MTLTQAADRAIVMWRGARARHKPCKHLHREAVRLRAKEMKNALRRVKKASATPDLFEVRQ